MGVIIKGEALQDRSKLFFRGLNVIIHHFAETDHGYISFRSNPDMLLKKAREVSVAGKRVVGNSVHGNKSPVQLDEVQRVKYNVWNGKEGRFVDEF